MTPDRERRLAEPPRRASKVKKAVRKTKGKSVFVVHGRDEALRKSMFDFLRALGLHPHGVGPRPQAGKVEGRLPIRRRYPRRGHGEKAQAVVVMFSQDDLA